MHYGYLLGPCWGGVVGIWSAPLRQDGHPDQRRRINFCRWTDRASAVRRLNSPLLLNPPGPPYPHPPWMTLREVYVHLVNAPPEFWRGAAGPGMIPLPPA